MTQVYFICTGNSCRSQMAEGFAKQLLGPDWRIASAGLRADGLNPRAVQVMAELGIDISKQRSKVIDLDYLRSSDLVVTLCGDARNHCPVVLVCGACIGRCGIRRLRWGRRTRLWRYFGPCGMRLVGGWKICLRIGVSLQI